MDIPCTSTVFPWLVKHAQWLINKYLIHSDGKTSWERRWGRPYDRGICDLLEAIYFRINGRLAKADAAWKLGLWVGKDTESDEHLVLTEEGAFKTRSIRRLPLADQQNKDLAGKVTGLPWSHKNNLGSGDADTFILPPRKLAHASDHDQAPKEDEHREDTLPAEEQEVGGDTFDDAEPVTPRTRPRESDELAEDFGTPSRRRLNRMNFGSPKREASEAQLLDIEEARSKALRVSCVIENDLFEESLNHVNTFICIFD